MHTISLFKANHAAASEAAVLDVLRSGQIAAGPKVGEFQHALSAWVGHGRAVTTDNMSSAMLLALHLLGVKAGDEVLTPAYTCLSSASPILHAGAQPRWVDVEPDSGLMDPKALEARFTPRTKACVVYHAAGYPARIREIAALCRDRNVPLVEDCNNALGATVDGERVGSLGDAAVYSFYPNRLLNAGEGGAVSFLDPAQADAALRLRRFGIPLTGFRDAMGEIDPHCDVPAIGWSAAMNQINSALGLAQLPDLAARLEATRARAKTLTTRLRDLPGLDVVAPGSGANPAYWGLLVQVRARDAVLAAIKREGVLASKLHHRLDTYSGFQSEAADLPGTANFLDQVIALPCGAWLTEADLDHMAQVVESALRTTR
jgi:perosamine synthetase